MTQKKPKLHKMKRTTKRVNLDGKASGHAGLKRASGAVGMSQTKFTLTEKWASAKKKKKKRLKNAPVRKRKKK